LIYERIQSCAGAIYFLLLAFCSSPPPSQDFSSSLRLNWFVGIYLLCFLSSRLQLFTQRQPAERRKKMSSKTIITTLSLLSVTSTLTAAQAFDKTSLLNRTIQSCADVQCPTKSTTATVACTLTNETYTNVGVSKIPDTSGLTWVEAIVGKDLETRHFFKDFFLATDPALDNVAGAGACAIFFTKVSGKVKWTESTFPVDVAQGTCAQAMSDQCVSKLIQRAKGVGLQGLRGEEACSKLKSAFATNLDAECGDFATGTTGWTGVEARGEIPFAV
jgi:hypothetical protein